jgi:shikimate kinase
VAAGISGKGPAYAFVVKEELKDSVLEKLREHEGQLIVTKTRRHPSFLASSLKKEGFSTIGNNNTPQ